MNNNEKIMNMREPNKITTVSRLGRTDGYESVEGVIKKKCPKWFKLMNGKNGGGFYVQYVHLHGMGTGWIKLRIKYPERPEDDECMDDYVEVLINKDDGTVADYDSNGIHTKSKKDWGLEVYHRPDMPVPVDTILRKIKENWDQIPIVELEKEVPFEEIHAVLIESGEDYARLYPELERPDCVLLDRQMIEDVAQECGTTFNEIRKQLEIRRLLKKDKGRGYQYSIKTGSYRYRYYAVRKVADDDMDVVLEASDLDYDGGTIKVLIGQEEREKREYPQLGKYRL